MTFFTAGLGAGGTAAVAGWRLSACARKIIKVLTPLKAVRAVTTIARTAPQLARVRSVLAKFKRARRMDNAADAAENAAKAEKLARARKTVNDPKLFNPQDLRGMSRKDLEDVLKDWPSKPSNSGDGIVYTDPVNKGRQIRLMPGYPGNRPDPLTHGPYVQVSQNGTKTKIPLEGNPTL